MVTNYKKIDLLGKTFIQKVVFEPHFEFVFPVSEQACFLYMHHGGMEYFTDGASLDIPRHYSLFLNCINSARQTLNSEVKGEIIIITFHADILRKIYNRELPSLLQTRENVISEKSGVKVENDFLIQNYIESLLFYFENPLLAVDDILILKLKEIFLLLLQTKDAESIQVILSQVFSPSTYAFKMFIETNLFTKAGIGDLARKMNLSVSSFKREFQRLYDDSPANYIKNKRLEKAAELLLASDNMVTDIAADCGFNSPATFIQNFYLKYNLTPKSYRLKLNNK
ncbi:helix-turn-helix transcriptional regulator [Pedobacter sp. 22163]|uniref:helix-turn-helix transcriptional regulator n=1 Tax=Pedobacter sp. 22163 TaxID=3453883 RepID=UPI003F8318BB